MNQVPFPKRADMPTDSPILLVQGLKVQVGDLPLLRGVNLEIRSGETLAIVGESGCGKSMTALAIMKLLPSGVNIADGSILYSGFDLTSASELQMRQIRGNEISIIFQDAASSLNPLMTVRKQLVEAIIAHQSLPLKQANKRAEELLKLVGIPDPKTRLEQYAFELSGGMCQRVMIATALACEPAILIADEPTTALDVTIQAQILGLIRDLQKKNQTAVILITHDLGVVADMADNVAVMYGGAIVESGDVFAILKNPRHPYTKLLLQTVPDLANVPKSKLPVIEGLVPDALNWPKGCRFHPRCPLTSAHCQQVQPDLVTVGEAGHLVACWHHDQVELLGEVE
jgi:peptide/nickel transport system ATP-binding protein